MDVEFLPVLEAAAPGACGMASSCPPFEASVSSAPPSSSNGNGTSQNQSLQAERHGSPSNDGSRPAKKSRKRRCPPTGEASQPQTFYFVDPTSSSREKRAHVMRHHIQEKRRQHKASAIVKDSQHARPLQSLQWQKKPAPVDPGMLTSISTPSASTTSTSITATMPDMTTSNNAQRRGHGDASREEVKPDRASHESSASSELQPIIPATAAVARISRISPVTMMDASRKDPFHSLPTTLGKDDLDLADYWTSKLTYWSGPNQYVKNKIFRAAMGNPLTFEAVVLSYCARWKDRIFRLPDSTTIQQHVAQPKRLIDEALSGKWSTDQETLAMALTGLSLSEDRFGDENLASQYADTAAQLIRPRVGLNPYNEVFFHFVRYVMAPQKTAIPTDGQQWLVMFLRGAEDLMMEQCTERYLAAVPQRRDTFRMDGTLYALLASGPRPTVVPQSSRIYVVGHAFMADVCRVASLIYITAALWEYRDSPSKTTRFLDHLCAIVTEHRLDRHPACETLIWVLLEEGYDMDMRDPERSWSTGELLKIFKQLPYDLQFLFSEILMSFLTLTKPIRGVDEFELQLERSLCHEVVE